jgi:putative ribosome biogenesis GTPase RsgA
VHAALAAGTISARRYESYRRLLRLQERFAAAETRRR